MKKRFKSKLSFDKAELQGRISMDYAGLAIAPAATDEAAKKRLMESFGLFGGSNNANTFYPDIANAADIVPKPEDFIDVPFRLISATIVGGGSWKATDFSNVQVLKNSVKYFQNATKPVYYDHDTDLLNWVGIVKAPKWTENFTNADGTKVPAGIDAIISIDAKTNPKIARGVLIGSIFSNSVTVEFTWEMSHHFESENEFNNKVGTYAADGTMIRRVVTSISDYHETSLVWLGADPFAKLIDANGNLTNIDAASISYDKAEVGEKSTYENSKNYKLGFAIDKNVIHLSRENFKPNKNTQMEKEILIALRKALGLADDAEVKVEMLSKLQLAPATPVVGITPEQTSKVTAFDKLKDIEVATAEKTEKFDGDVAKFAIAPDTHIVVAKDHFSKLTTEAAKVAGLESEKVSLQADATLGKEYIGLQKKEAVRLYKVAVGADKADAAVIGLFEKATPEELKGLLAQYTKGVTMKFSGKCKDCNSENFEFRSSVQGEEGAAGETVVASTFESIYGKFANETMDITTKK